MYEVRFFNFYFSRKKMKHLTDDELIKSYQELLSRGISCWASSVGKQLMEQELKKRNLNYEL